jgi:Secretion system C-terminal sorting domain/HYDIN/CFA65/VesB-like, Ig-like domain
MLGIIDFYKIFKKQILLVIFLSTLISNHLYSQTISKSATFLGLTDRVDLNSELIEINQHTGLGKLIFESDTLGAFSLAINSEGSIIAANKDNGFVYTIDSSSGSLTYEFNSNLPSLSCIAFTPSDQLYAFDRNGNLYHLDLINDTARFVISTGESYRGITFDPTWGVLYGCTDSTSYEKDAIVNIDTLTGSATVLGYTLLEGPNVDIAFDQTGRLYGLKGGLENPNYLFEINLETGEGIVVGDSIGFRGITSLAAQFLSIDEDQPQILVDPPFIQYGDVFLETFVEQVLRIHNPGDVNLIVSLVEIKGTNSDDFAIVWGGTSFTVYQNSYRDLTIRFTPADLDSSNAYLEITSDDPDENIVVIPLTGNGVSPLLPDIVVDPEAHDFGEVVIGKVKGMTFKITNDGDTDLQITSMGMGGTNSSEFFFAPIKPSSQMSTNFEFPFNISPGDTHNVDVIVIPKTKGDKNAILTIRSDDPDEDPFYIPLAAVALGIPDISVTPRSYYYGNVDPGSSKDQIFTINNDGEEDLIISATGLSGFNASEFSIISGGAPITILPHRSNNLTIRFEPQTTNEKYADLVIESNDPDENPYTVELSGNRGGEPPVIKIVQPYYDPALSMYIEWTEIIGAEEYQYRRKVDNGVYSDWVSTGTTISFLDNAISAGPEYTYQVRVKLEGEFSFASKPRSSRAIKVWPVKKDSLSTSADSREILNGFNTALQASAAGGGTVTYLHEGLDIQGEGNINDECVVAPVGGVVTGIGANNAGSNIFVNIRIRIANQVRNIQFNHLKAFSVNPELTVGWSVAPGEKIGLIASGWFGSPINNHTHFHYWDNNMMIDARNPLLLFDRNENRDPYGLAPVVANTNADGQVIRFTRGINTNNYFPTNTVVYAAADIVAEIMDHQSKDIPWVTPQRAGYYIKQHRDGVLHDIVRDANEPYILLDGANWYGNSNTRPPILFDLNIALAASTPAFRPAQGWPLWYTYKVTNTSGTDGSIATLDANQCWATNAHNSEAAPNGYRSWYSVANVNEEALFPDRYYSVFIRSGDFVNTAADYSHKVLVDNLRPYVKKCLVESASSTIYFAKWDWDGNYLGLDPAIPKDGMTGSAKVDKDVKIIITTSEPMDDVFIEDIQPLSCGRINHSSVNTDSTEWMFFVDETLIPDDGSKNGKNIIHIRGTDKAGNPLEGYNENIIRYYRNSIPKRQENGSWNPAPTAGADRMHRFIIGNVDVAFVIDDTGSMGEEISGVRQALLNHLATYEDDSTTTFLLVTFKDGVSIGEPTSELSLIQSQVSALYASGGGDCPEGSVEAIDAIRDLMNDNGRVFLATDAAPHPGVDNSATIAALQARGVRVDVILSGDCDDLEKILKQLEEPSDMAMTKDNLKSIKAIKNKVYTAETLTDTLQLNDEDFRALPLPFKFPFSDQEYDSIFVGSNGYITFETGSANSYATYSALLTGPPILAGFFTDLAPQDGGRISYGQVGEEFHVVFDTIPNSYPGDKITFSIVLRPDGSFAFIYGEIEIRYGIVGFSVGKGVLDPGQVDISDVEQPIAAKNYGTTYQTFSYDVDIFNTILEFERVTYVKPPTYNAIQAFSLMAKETGGIFAYVPEVNSFNTEDVQRFENIIFNLVQGAITQSLVFVEPKKAPQGTDLTISLTGSGTNFQSTTTLNISGSGITVKRVNAVSSIHLEADIHIDNSTELGFKDITAITSLGSGITDTARGVGAFEVISQPFYPTVVGITPSSGQPGQSLTVLIYGVKTNFSDSSEVDMGSGILVNSVKKISPTILQANISIATNTVVGFRDITVISGNEWAYENLTGPFFVSMTSPEKSELISINPSFAAPGAKLTLTIKGNNTHFMSGSSVVTFSGTGIKLLSVEVIDTTELNAEIEIDTDVAPGFRDVRVNTDTESAVFLSGLLITTNKPKVQITTAVFQNPAATKYCDIVVVTDQLLSSQPQLKISVSGDTTNVPMSLIEGSDDVYKGSYEFYNGGEHSIITSVQTTGGIDSVNIKNFEVLLAKQGFNYVLQTPDKEAKLFISKSHIINDIYFLADHVLHDDEKVYMFGPEAEFNKSFELEILYNKIMYANSDKLFIYQFNGEDWIALPSKVYPMNNSIVAQVNKLGKFKVVFDSTYSGNNTVPSNYALKQCYPNPFNPSTTIEYYLPEDAYINLTIYDAIGQEIIRLEDNVKSAGRYSIHWDASGIASGIYFYQLQAGEFIDTKKMILLR